MVDDSRALDPSTLVVATGRPSAEPGGLLNAPVSLASVYRSGADVGYGRYANPTWSALEEAIGALEGGSVLAFSSGMAAISAVLDLLPADAVVVAPEAAYSGTRALLADLEERGRLSRRLVDVTDTGAVRHEILGADLLWLESPTNPLMGIADLPTLIAAAHDAGAFAVVDNTFATPLLQQPLALGADVVVHSVTKFLSGHSDLVLGCLATGDEELLAQLHARRSLTGAIPGPMEAWLALRGLRTLAVRLERSQATAGELARRLAAHPAVARVRYPGLAGDPGHELASKQMTGFGAMVSFEVAAGQAAASALCGRVQLIVHATSLGGVETSLERRGDQPGEEAVPPALIRMSVGLEHVDDLWADLQQALGT